MLQLQTSSTTRGNGDRLRLGMNSQTRQTPTKTESNSSDRHINQALHLHQLAISYTQADIGDPVKNRQNMSGSISVLTTCGFVMKSNCNTLKNFVCWKILVCWKIADFFIFLLLVDCSAKKLLVWLSLFLLIKINKSAFRWFFFGDWVFVIYYKPWP